LDELSLTQRLVHFANSKRHVMFLKGWQVRQPLVDLDLLRFLENVPLEYRVGKRLVRQAIRQRRPNIHALPRSRSTENVNYHDTFRRLEQDGGKVSRFIFEDNPLLDEFFDRRAIAGLIEQIASSDPPKRRVTLRDLIPPQARRVLAGIARRFLNMHAPYLVSPSERLLRLAMVAEALRHISRGCVAPESVQR
jgi:hypothetical protein